ncbi:hypothetical protein NE237_018455 [Protea cynaroides]|uniref:Uncharacterized protein n=1 Tax=Protea cynaroides TaxID=273540 RepID=A0A9Q0KA35_9MAGN|nr:hypothetical protein NE237_018455 [Protea cynaroides]
MTHDNFFGSQRVGDVGKGYKEGYKYPLILYLFHFASVAVTLLGFPSHFRVLLWSPRTYLSLLIFLASKGLELARASGGSQASNGLQGPQATVEREASAALTSGALAFEGWWELPPYWVALYVTSTVNLSLLKGFREMYHISDSVVLRAPKPHDKACKLTCTEIVENEALDHMQQGMPVE